MDYKHFSHQHNLCFHQMQNGYEIHCSGSNSPGSGSVYASWQCNFFLHEKCFLANRSIEHPSHASHPLTLLPYPTYCSGSFLCNACGLFGTGFSYTCSHCDFDLHVHCASLTGIAVTKEPQPQFTNPMIKPNSNSQMGVLSTHADNLAHQLKNVCIADAGQDKANRPPRIQHKSHPEHPLMLVSPPPYDSGEFTCNACGQTGDESTYHCPTCQFDVHEKCVNLDETVIRDDHEHPLTLLYNSMPWGDEPGTFTCDVCHAGIPNSRWMYYCSEGCDYGTHLGCATAEVNPMVQQMDSMLKAQQDMLQAQLRLRMQAQFNSIIASSTAGWRLI